MFVIFELIEAWRTQALAERCHRAGRLVMRFDGAMNCPRAFDGYASLNLLFNFVCRGADEHRSRIVAEHNGVPLLQRFESDQRRATLKRWTRSRRILIILGGKDKGSDSPSC